MPGRWASRFRLALALVLPLMAPATCAAAAAAGLVLPAPSLPPARPALLTGAMATAVPTLLSTLPLPVVAVAVWMVTVLA